MAKRTSYISPYVIDGGWPYQVALQDDLCAMENMTRLNAYLDGNAISCRTRSVQARWADHNIETYRVHCFRSLEDAVAFMARFGGVVFDPRADRKGGSSGREWHRAGPYVRFLASGSLRVPKLLVF